MSEDYSALASAKSLLEAQVAELSENSQDVDKKIKQLEGDKIKMKATIKELEKRRDQAIKEIRSLKHQIHKDKKAAQVSAATPDQTN